MVGWFLRTFFGQTEPKDRSGRSGIERGIRRWVMGGCRLYNVVFEPSDREPGSHHETQTLVFFCAAQLPPLAESLCRSSPTTRRRRSEPPTAASPRRRLRRAATRTCLLGRPVNLGDPSCFDPFIVLLRLQVFRILCVLFCFVLFCFSPIRLMKGADRGLKICNLDSCVTVRKSW
jgi:hypothetical protein